MGHRNLRYTGPMIDMEMDQQGQGHFHPEPCVLYGSMPNFPQPNFNTVLPVPGNRTNFDIHHLPEHHGAASYGMTQYNGVQHQYPAGNIELAVSTASNHYNMYMTPSPGTRVFPVPLSYGPHDQFQLSSHPGIYEVSADSFGRINHFMDVAGGSFKRKNAEALSTNFQYSYSSAGSSSSAPPISARPIESDVNSMDAPSFSVPDGRGNDVSSVMDVGFHRSVRNRSVAMAVDPLLAHNANHLIQGHYPGQPFPAAGTPWMDQQFNRNASDIGTLSWNQPHGPHALPYMHGNLNGGCMEAANMGVQAYQVTASNRGSATFLPPPPIPQGHFNLHHPPPPMQGTRGHNIDSSSTHTSLNPFQDSVETGSRFVGHVPPTGLRYRPQRREPMLDSTARQRNLPHLRVLPEDGVAILEFSDYHEMGDSIDHHRDMRLDIDHMSYEELLALGEQIGSVGSGLSEEVIIGHLKSRTFDSSMEDTTSVDQELNFCVICQTNYEDQQVMGILDCGHEYHLECIKKWLLVKNSCPICKSAALNTESKES